MNQAYWPSGYSSNTKQKQQLEQTMLLLYEVAKNNYYVNYRVK